MFVGALAIAGIPVLAGFFSKDEILWKAWESGHPLLWATGAAAAALTAFYMFRLIYMTFFGSFRGTHEQEHHLHESPPSMVVPLVILAVLSIVGGWIGIPHALGQYAGIPNWFEHWIGPALASVPAAEGGGHGGSMEYVLMLVAIVIAVAGILTARRFYRGGGDLPGRVAAAVGPLYGLVANKYWVDELYDATVLKAYYGICALSDGFDRWVIDWLVNAVAGFTEIVGQVLRLFQTGFVRNYALFIFAGAVLIIWMLGR
jgi:NADH-quinone oxidoreductase subunit L